MTTIAYMSNKRKKPETALYMRLPALLLMVPKARFGIGKSRFQLFDATGSNHCIIPWAADFGYAAVYAIDMLSRYPKLQDKYS